MPAAAGPPCLTWLLRLQACQCSCPGEWQGDRQQRENVARSSHAAQRTELVYQLDRRLQGGGHPSVRQLGRVLAGAGHGGAEGAPARAAQRDGGLRPADARRAALRPAPCLPWPQASLLPCCSQACSACPCLPRPSWLAMLACAQRAALEPLCGADGKSEVSLHGSCVRPGACSAAASLCTLFTPGLHMSAVMLVPGCSLPDTCLAQPGPAPAAQL